MARDLLKRRVKGRHYMNKGIYIAASGAMLKQTQLDVISQNIANVNTTGYKKAAISFRDYLIPQEHAATTPDGRVMSDFSEITTDFSSGTLMKTGNPLDVAIEGEGFFALEGGSYTRRGDLKKDRDGYLTTSDGTKVLGDGGPIQIPADSIELNIDSEGKVSVMQPGSSLPSEIDTIKIVNFGPDANLSFTGNGKYIATGDGTRSTATLNQGYREASNVESVTEMIRMIESMREFESYQKVIQTFDELSSKVNNDLGRV